jgi:thiol-disulfide isomerase/thioredoxin
MTDTFNNFVVYGEIDDFNSDGSLKEPNGVPTIIFLGASWCGHCKTLKPAYGESAEKLKGKVRFMTLQDSDEEKSNMDACKMISKIINLKGFPTLLKLNKEGKIVEEYNGKRTQEAICEWSEK